MQILTRRTTEDGRIQNALDRAQEANHRAWQMADNPNHYRVCSFTTVGNHYDIWITSQGLLCNCLAGQSRQVCKHTALVGLRLRREHKSEILSDWFHEKGQVMSDEEFEQAIMEALPSHEQASGMASDPFGPGSLLPLDEELPDIINVGGDFWIPNPRKWGSGKSRIDEPEPEPSPYGKCYAYKEDGTICGEPAVTFHPITTNPLCEYHRSAQVKAFESRNFPKGPKPTRGGLTLQELYND